MVFPSGMKRIELEMVLVALEQDRCPMQITWGGRVYVSYPRSATDHTINWSSVDHLTAFFVAGNWKTRPKTTHKQLLADLSRQVFIEKTGKLKT